MRSTVTPQDDDISCFEWFNHIENTANIVNCYFNCQKIITLSKSTHPVS